MSKPEKTFRIGATSASVFSNSDGRERSFHTVSLQRRYKDGEEWKTSSTFTLAQLPAAIAVLQLAMHYIAATAVKAGE